MERLQGTEKRGPRRRKAGWRLNISNIPTPIGDALDRLWREQCIEAVERGITPIGWHAFVIFAWISYLKSVQTIDENEIMMAKIREEHVG